MKVAAICFTACVVACYLHEAQGISITQCHSGLKPAVLLPMDCKRHHKTTACKICEFPCLGLSLCLTPMLDPHHPKCPKFSIPRHTETETEVSIKESSYRPHYPKHAPYHHETRLQVGNPAKE